MIDFIDPLVVAEKIAVTDRNRIVTEKDISEELRRRRKKSRRKICKRKKVDIMLLKYYIACDK